MKKIEDYINKGKYAIYSSSKEEWNSILALIQKVRQSKPHADYKKSEYDYLNLNSVDNWIGVGSRDSYKKFTIYNASEFLEDKKQVLGFYNIGDIVVSLSKARFSDREIGDIYKVLPKSNMSNLYYTINDCNDCSSEWRLATYEEVIAFNQGIKNIYQISSKELEEFPKALVPFPNGI